MNSIHTGISEYSSHLVGVEGYNLLLIIKVEYKLYNH